MNDIVNPEVGFLSKAVFESRRQYLDALMERQDLDAIALLDTSNVLFATNFFVDVMPWERPIIAVFPRRGEPFLLLNELSTNSLRFSQERGSVWVEDVSFYSEHVRLSDRVAVLPQWDDHVAELLRRHDLQGRRIGFDGSRFGSIAALLHGTVPVPVAAELQTWRHVKTGEEKNLLRAASSLSDWAQERYRENLAVGRYVQELDYYTMAQMLEEAGRRLPGQRVEVQALTLRGPESAAPHGTGAWTGSRIEEGDSIVNIFVVRLNGMTVENERTWFCGSPSDAQVAAYQAVNEAHEAAIECMRPDRRVCDFDAAAHRVLVAHGLDQYVNTRAGHGMGTDNHEFPFATAFDTRPLERDEVFAVEPGIYIFGLGGFRNSDTVIVGEEPEVLSRTPRDIPSQTITPRQHRP